MVKAKKSVSPKQAVKRVTTKKIVKKVTTKTGRMQKMVSLPADIHRRLDEYPDVNWSAVARQAFEIKLGELASDKETKNMSDVVSRLRASKMELENEMHKAGMEAGKKWAEDSAEAGELQRIERLEDSTQDWSGWFENTGNNAFASFETFHATVMGYDRPDRAEAKEFFDCHGADEEEMYDGEYVRGFAEGALNVWYKVKDQL